MRNNKCVLYDKGCFGSVRTIINPETHSCYVAKYQQNDYVCQWLSSYTFVQNCDIPTSNPSPVYLDWPASIDGVTFTPSTNGGKNGNGLTEASCDLAC
jgi:hypothetical protein